MDNLEMIKQLQKQLADMKAEQDKKAKEELIRITAEESKRRQEEELEREMRKAEYEEKRRKLEEAAKKREQALEAEQKKAQAERHALEMEKVKAAKLNEEQAAFIQSLKDELERVKFQEEQNQKLVEDLKFIAKNKESAIEENVINVEHPEAPVNKEAPGDAVVGTDGNTPDTPLMSTHLKHILRQAVRNY